MITYLRNNFIILTEFWGKGISIAVYNYGRICFEYHLKKKEFRYQVIIIDMPLIVE